MSRLMLTSGMTAIDFAATTGAVAMPFVATPGACRFVNHAPPAATEARIPAPASAHSTRLGCCTFGAAADTNVPLTTAGRRHMTQTLQTAADPKVVEGSDGLLLEIDGQIVPNYDATFAPFEEGDVVTGRVVRIDNDEVLVDIGYKSEGVIPSNELSIRKNVDPHDEVELGEEVDALVLTKEDQDGRLIMSKKRARFEKAWRRIEAAAESRRARRGHRHRGGQGRPDHRPRRARLPARLAGRHPPRAQPRRVHGHEDRDARSSSSTARATTSSCPAARSSRRSARSSARRSSTACSPA